MKDMRSYLFIGSILLFCVVPPALLQGQENALYDTTYVKHFKVPVTYYDYHVDGSNPDFGDRATARWNQTGLPNGNYSGWADSSLSADKSPKRFPALTDTFLSISWNLEKLFKPWVMAGKDTFVWKTAPYARDSFDDTGAYVKTDTIKTPDTLMISDTMYKNDVIFDSLVFTRVINDLPLDDPVDSIWVAGDCVNKIDPIEGRGFGDEGDAQNAGYTFRLNNRFIYHGGEILYVSADDDAYTYINGKIAIEGGGFHGVTRIQKCSIDSLNLTVGNKYDVDIFFVERRMGGGIFIAGLSDFEAKGAVYLDAEVHERDGVIFNSKKSIPHKGTVIGLRVPPSSQKVKIEYFTASGVKLANREMPLAQALTDQSVGLPQGMYVVRVTFLNAQGKRISTESLHKMIMRK